MDKRAFTLIELLVVIAIIGLLATLAMVSYRYAQEQSKIAKAEHEVDSLVLAMKQLETDTGQWPGHQSVDQVVTSGANEIWDLNLAAAGLTSTDGNYQSWNGPYMVSVPKDPWGQDYFYDSDYQFNGEDKVVIGSFGPNGVGQNVYDSDNIIKILR